MAECSPTGNSRFHRIVKASHKEPHITESDSHCSLKFIRLPRVVFSSQQRLNRRAVNAVQ